MEKTQPILIKAGSTKVLLDGEPPKVDCRVVAETRYQEMNHIYNLHTKVLQELNADKTTPRIVSKNEWGCAFLIALTVVLVAILISIFA